jgi:hypothetical protein
MYSNSNFFTITSSTTAPHSPNPQPDSNAETQKVNIAKQKKKGHGSTIFSLVPFL